MCYIHELKGPTNCMKANAKTSKSYRKCLCQFVRKLLNGRANYNAIIKTSCTFQVSINLQ